MNYLKLSIGIFIFLSASRFIPHPPNFTSLLALSFYVPVLFGIKFIPVVLVSFIISDYFFGFHAVSMFTWGSVVAIGLMANYFNKNILFRISGALGGCTVFFVLTNFGVWSLGQYGHTLEGLIMCFTLAIPFFGYNLISTLFFSSIIEFIYSLKIVRNYFITK